MMMIKKILHVHLLLYLALLNKASHFLLDMANSSFD